MDSRKLIDKGHNMVYYVLCYKNAPFNCKSVLRPVIIEMQSPSEIGLAVMHDEKQLRDNDLLIRQFVHLGSGQTRYGTEKQSLDSCSFRGSFTRGRVSENYI